MKIALTYESTITYVFTKAKSIEEAKKMVEDMDMNKGWKPKKLIKAEVLVEKPSKILKQGTN